MSYLKRAEVARKIKARILEPALAAENDPPPELATDAFAVAAVPLKRGEIGPLRPFPNGKDAI
jgi:hypothetical protein